MQEEALAALRNQVGDIIFGAIFVFVGLAACTIAAMRRRGGVLVFVWLGAWSAMYGLRLLLQSQAFVTALPQWVRPAVPYVDIACMYLLIVAAALAWLELSIGKLRVFFQVVIAAGLAIAVASMGWFIFTGSNDRFILYNNLLAAFALVVLIAAVTIPGLFARWLVLPMRGVLAAGCLIFGVEALYVHAARYLQWNAPPVANSLGFAALLFSFGFVAMRIALTNERKLLSVENELEIARQLQRSILPASVPAVRGVQVGAAYEPMTAVGGDFYEFVPVDQHRIGLLVADVSGHGVPAALIAAMIKTAVQSVVACAASPREVLRGLDRILFHQLRGQFVSAAYLWLDTEARMARYSAAGHPPLLCFRNGELKRIESNGLLFGVIPGTDYPVCEMPLHSGDRFLLYTDGVTEPENASGEAFGDHRLEAAVRSRPFCKPSELSTQLVGEIRNWQGPPEGQQDDITLLVIDVE
jgi:phosphoserine phosphatase RsbU/P